MEKNKKHLENDLGVSMIDTLRSPELSSIAKLDFIHLNDGFLYQFTSKKRFFATSVVTL